MKKTGYLFFKRVFDVVASIVAIIVLLIPWLIISVIIRIQSHGAVIYKAARVGKSRRIFILYKFRSMRVDSGKVHLITLKNDPRIFSFGQFLRISKLDETPQFINVLKGDMSIIGPRPEDEVNSQRIYTGEYKQILSVKPGLSSPASLYDYTHGENYPDEETYIKEFLPKKLEVELYYVKHRSAAYDLHTVWRTIVTILQIVCGKENFKEPKEVKKCKKAHGI